MTTTFMSRVSLVASRHSSTPPCATTSCNRQGFDLIIVVKDYQRVRGRPRPTQKRTLSISYSLGKYQWRLKIRNFHLQCWLSSVCFDLTTASAPQIGFGDVAHRMCQALAQKWMPQRSIIKVSVSAWHWSLKTVSSLLCKNCSVFSFMWNTRLEAIMGHCLMFLSNERLRLKHQPRKH